jgi:hypothetical protein
VRIRERLAKLAGGEGKSRRKHAMRGRVILVRLGDHAAEKAALWAFAFVLAGAISLAAPARAEPLVVLEARGTGSTAGNTIDSASRLTLERGEHIRLIAQNGNQYCLDGPYDGPAEPARKKPSGFDWLASLFFGSRAEDRADRFTDCLR